MSTQAKSICQQQKPQRSCSELLKYLTLTNDDPPHQTHREIGTAAETNALPSKRRPTQSQTLLTEQGRLDPWTPTAGVSGEGRAKLLPRLRTPNLRLLFHRCLSWQSSTLYDSRERKKSFLDPEHGSAEMQPNSQSSSKGTWNIGQVVGDGVQRALPLSQCW